MAEDELVIGECSCCESENVKVNEFSPSVVSKTEQTRLLCNLCASTMTSTLSDSTRGEMSHVEIMKTICFVGNEVIKQIRRDICSVGSRLSEQISGSDD